MHTRKIIDTEKSDRFHLRIALYSPWLDARIRLEATMKIRWSSAAAVLLCVQLAFATDKPAAKHKTVYDYSMVTYDGKEVSLSTYKGKVLLIVNLASKSIYKSQLKSLEDLRNQYSAKGFELIGIPSTDFGTQELSDNQAIHKYYADEEHITFPVFAKASLRGKDAIPLVSLLKDPKDGAGGGDIHWNFTKFLIDRQGQPIARFEADTDPSDPEFHVTVEQLLDGKFKKKEGSSEHPPQGTPDGDDDGGV
jgi:glutathione peroxidase